MKQKIKINNEIKIDKLKSSIKDLHDFYFQMDFNGFAYIPTNILMKPKSKNKKPLLRDLHIYKYIYVIEEIDNIKNKYKSINEDFFNFYEIYDIDDFKNIKNVIIRKDTKDLTIAQDIMGRDYYFYFNADRSNNSKQLCYSFKNEYKKTWSFSPSDLDGYALIKDKESVLVES